MSNVKFAESSHREYMVTRTNIFSYPVGTVLASRDESVYYLIVETEGAKAIMNMPNFFVFENPDKIFDMRFPMRVANTPFTITIE